MAALHTAQHISKLVLTSCGVEDGWCQGALLHEYYCCACARDGVLRLYEHAWNLCSDLSHVCAFTEIGAYVRARRLRSLRSLSRTTKSATQGVCSSHSSLAQRFLVFVICSHCLIPRLRALYAHRRGAVSSGSALPHAVADRCVIQPAGTGRSTIRM